MPKNSFLQATFRGPRYSFAPIHKNNRGNCRIGEVIPVGAWTLPLGHSIELDMGHLVRFMPLKAPTMEGYKVTFDAFAVPMSTLAYPFRKERDVMEFFNVKENGGESLNPFCIPFADFQKSDLSGNMELGRLFELGKLGDYLDFPSMKSFRDYVRSWIAKTPLFDGDFADWFTGNYQSRSSVLDFAARALLNSVHVSDDSSSDYVFCVPFWPFSDFHAPSNWNVSTYPQYYVTHSGLTLKSSRVDGVCSLLGYILEKYPLVASYYSYDVFLYDINVQEDSFNDAFAHWVLVLTERNAVNPIDFDYLSKLYELYKVDAQSIFDDWFETVVSTLLFNRNLVQYTASINKVTLMDAGYLPDILSEDMKPVDMSYFAAYWKIISDWYINTNIDGDPDDFYINHCNVINDEIPNYATVELTPFRRRWSNDIFTSAVPAQQVNNIRIPVDGTIPDLREANAYQKLVDIFRNTGTRLRDVLYGLMGIRPSAMASEMSVPIGTLSTWLGAQSVLQTSQTTPDSPQAAYAGIATDSSEFRHLLKYINKDEPTPVIIMVMMHVSQDASYFQGFSRKFFHNNIYDFAIPQLANIGEQEVYASEVYFDWNPDGGELENPVGRIFGFNRRYYDWFFDQSEVHGDLRDSLDYWHGAREFDSPVSLNSEFIGMDSELDHLNRIYANTSESARNIVYNIRFDGGKVVPLPRYIQYEL